MSNDTVDGIRKAHAVAAIVGASVLTLGAMVSAAGWIITHFATAQQVKEIENQQRDYERETRDWQTKMEKCILALGHHYAARELSAQSKMMSAHVPYVRETVMMLAVHTRAIDLLEQPVDHSGGRSRSEMYRTNNGEIDWEKEMDHRKQKRQQEWGKFMAAFEEFGSVAERRKHTEGIHPCGEQWGNP